MLDSAIELISLTHSVNYEPTLISTDRRNSDPSKTTLRYFQIGELQQYGYAKGPIFKVEFADLSGVSATHIKIWGLENLDDDAPLYPVSYLTTWRPIVDVYLKKFIFCDSDGDPVSESGTYSIIGYKKKSIPAVW